MLGQLLAMPYEQVIGNVNGVKVVFKKIVTTAEGKRDRVKIEVSPYPLISQGLVDVIFARVGHVISDPDSIEPKRPAGHCYEDHMPETRRWDPDEEPELVARIKDFATLQDHQWRFLYTDGGSNYYSHVDYSPWRRQMALSSRRVMIGYLEPVQWEVYIPELGGMISLTSLLQKRMVTDVGSDTKRSPLWTPQYASGGFAWP